MEPNAVIEWVRDTLMTKVMVVKTDEEHKYLWGKSAVRMILILPPETEPPLFYLTLSAKGHAREGFWLTSIIVVCDNSSFCVLRNILTGVVFTQQI
ncbi:hypothetical protein CHUAL_011227 [Chamberlinius hualienensis]